MVKTIQCLGKKTFGKIKVLQWIVCQNSSNIIEMLV